MNENKKADESTDGPSARSAGRTVVGQVLAVSLVIALATAAVYYGSKLAHTNSFNDERAFRVLGSMVSQIGNLQTSREMTLLAVPEKAIQNSGICLDNIDSQRNPNSDRATRQYLARLDLQGANLCTASQEKNDHDFVSAKCDGAGNDTLFLFSRAAKRIRVVTIACGRGTTKSSLQDFLDPQANAFVGQSYFDNVLMANSKGEVLAEFPEASRGTDSGHVSIHSSTAQELSLTSVHRLLMRSRGEQASGVPGLKAESEKPDPTAEEPTGQPMTFDDTIGSRQYRLYVLPFTPSSRVLTADQEKGLYFVGIKRENLGSDISNALWPDGAWLITLGTAAIVLIWPLLAIVFGSARESISMSRAVMCVLAVAVLPGVLTIAIASMWGYAATENWLKQNAENYANTIERKLHGELLEGARILVDNRPVYESLFNGDSKQSLAGCGALSEEMATKFATTIRNFAYVIRHDAAKEFAAPTNLTDGFNPCDNIQLSGKDPLLSWSPIRSIYVFNAEGARFGPTISSFGDANASNALRIDDREYFKALKRGEAWQPAKADGDPPFLAQRLYNKTDSSKALQVAVPLCASTGQASQFCGVMTGALRTHALIDPISPPLLQFAVIDRETGMVLFHTDDQRSLTENFFVETESDFALQAAIRSSRKTSFSGTYLGVSHGFFYVPVRDTPWGVVTFYSRKELYDLPAHAGTAALAMYLGGAAMIAVFIFFMCRFVRTLLPVAPRLESVLAGAWPVMPMPRVLRRGLAARPSLLAMLMLVLVMVYGNGFGIWPVVWVLVAGFLLGWIYVAVIRRRARGSLNAESPPAAPSSPIDQRSRKQREDVAAYLDLFRCVVLVISVVFALQIYYRLHDFQIAGLLRASAANAAADQHGRLELIQNDLQRWDPSPASTSNRYPSPKAILNAEEKMYFGSQALADRVTNKLAALPSEQIQDQEATWRRRTLFAVQPWSPGRSRLKPTSFESSVWALTAGSTAQAVRQTLTRVVDDSKRTPEITCDYDPASDPVTDGCTLIDPFGHSHEAIVSLGPTAGTFSMQSPNGRVNTALLVLALAGLWLMIDSVARFLGRRVFGLEASYQLRRFADPERAKEMAKDADSKTALVLGDFNLRWERLTDRERVLLADLANGDLPNPRNSIETRKLIDDGWIDITRRPKIANECLATLIRHAAPPEKVAPLRE